MQTKIAKKIEAVVKELFGQDVAVDLARPDEQFGDYATNVALQIAGKLNKNPREIADALVEKVKDLPQITEVTVAGPGFLNIKLSDEALWAEATADPAKTLDGKKVVIETNNPNPFKDIHIGHAFNSIVADTISNLLMAGGAEVHRVSYHGDVGLHVGKSLWAIFEEYGDKAPEELSKISEQDFPVKMREWYARGAGIYEEEPSIKEQVESFANASFAPEAAIKKVYDICREQSFKYFDKVFERLGSKPVEKRYLESETDKAGRAVVEAHVGKVFEKSDGAIIFPGEKYGLHTRVFISKRGHTLYEARDLGLIQLKAKDFSPEKSYIVTANEQKEYFRVVLKAAELAMPDIKTKTINIPTGTVKLTTGKMSSRTGQVVTIEWLFAQIEQAVRELTDKEETVRDSALAAIRYTMLKSRLDGDIIFDINQSVALEGNTGPYLQYAHARAKSIMRKAKSQNKEALSFKLSALGSGERNLLRKISEYPEVVEKATAELMPHHICTYLYELAQKFNSFYEHNRVIGDPREAERLQLVGLYADTLKKGLALLNIPSPEQM